MNCKPLVTVLFILCLTITVRSQNADSFIYPYDIQIVIKDQYTEEALSQYTIPVNVTRLPIVYPYYIHVHKSGESISIKYSRPDYAMINERCHLKSLYEKQIREIIFYTKYTGVYYLQLYCYDDFPSMTVYKGQALRRIVHR